MIYLSAGHSPNSLKPDPGAIGNGHTEAALTIELRNLVVDELRKANAPVWTDNDTQRLPEVLKSIDSTAKDVVCDIHFNAGPPSATGVEVLIPSRHTNEEMLIASTISTSLASAMRIRNRGVKTEAQSHHGSLGIMRENGINVLVEVCFISNASDVQAYQFNKTLIAKELAQRLIEADNRIK